MPEEPPSDDGLFRLVDSLGFDLEPSILIGGWATKFLVGGEISRDIDLIIYSPEVRQRLRTFSRTTPKIRSTVAGVRDGVC